MIIDILIHKNTFAKRIFLSFKNLAKEVMDGRLGRIEFLKQWMPIILNLEKYPAYDNEFWVLVNSIPGEYAGGVDGLCDKFISLNKKIK